MAELAETPTVVISDGNGTIPGMEIYDPLSESNFLGKALTPLTSNAPPVRRSRPQHAE